METNSTNAVKSFFQRPEGKTGVAAIILLSIAGLVGLYAILPFVITLLQNTLYTIGLLAAVAVIIGILTSKKVHMGFQVVMRWITAFFVNLDKIAVIKVYIQGLIKSHDSMSERIGQVAGEIRSLEREVQNSRSDVEKSLKIASVAKEQGIKGQVWANTRKAERRKQAAIKLSDLLTQLKKIHKVLTQMYDVTGYVIEDLTDEVNIKEREYKSIKQAHAAMTSAMSVLNGNPDKRAMFEMALEQMEEEVCQKLGAMDRFMDMSEGLVQSINVEQGYFAEEGLAMLEEFENGGFDDFFNDFNSTKSNPEKKIIGEKTTNFGAPVSFQDLKKGIDYQEIKKDGETNKYF